MYVFNQKVPLPFREWKEAKTNQMRKAKLTESEVVLVREPAAITCIWQRLKGRWRSRTALQRKRRPRCAWWRLQA